MIRPAALLTAGLLALASAAAVGQDATQPEWPSWRTPAPDAARGATLAAVCQACHSANSAQANPPAPRLWHQRQSYVFFALRAYREGERTSPIMAAFARNLTDSDMRDIAAYVSGEMYDRPPQARTDLPGYAIASTQCATCHGETGIGEFEGMPVLTGQDPAYLTVALAEYRSGARSNPTMRDVVAQVDPATDTATAEYFAAHTWLEHRP